MEVILFLCLESLHIKLVIAGWDLIRQGGKALSFSFWPREAHVIPTQEINCGPKTDVQPGFRQLIMSHYM